MIYISFNKVYSLFATLLQILQICYKQRLVSYHVHRVLSTFLFTFSRFHTTKSGILQVIMLYATSCLCFYEHYKYQFFKFCFAKFIYYLILAMSISVSFWISVFSRLVISAFAVSIAVSTLTPVSIAFLRITNPSLE